MTANTGRRRDKANEHGPVHWSFPPDVFLSAVGRRLHTTDRNAMLVGVKDQLTLQAKRFVTIRYVPAGVYRALNLRNVHARSINSMYPWVLLVRSVHAPPRISPTRREQKQRGQRVAAQHVTQPMLAEIQT